MSVSHTGDEAFLILIVGPPERDEMDGPYWTHSAVFLDDGKEATGWFVEREDNGGWESNFGTRRVRIV